MNYSFYTRTQPHTPKMVSRRGNRLQRLLVKHQTSPKKFLKYLEELKASGCTANQVYETSLLVKQINWDEGIPEKINRLRIHESCIATDDSEVYEITRISRNLCSCTWIGDNS